MADVTSERPAAARASRTARSSGWRAPSPATGSTSCSNGSSELEAEVQECRQLNIRLAEVTDLVEQLLLPIAAQDEEKIAAAVEKYTRTI